MGLRWQGSHKGPNSFCNSFNTFPSVCQSRRCDMKWTFKNCVVDSLPPHSVVLGHYRRRETPHKLPQTSLKGRCAVLSLTLDNGRYYPPIVIALAEWYDVRHNVAILVRPPFPVVDKRTVVYPDFRHHCRLLNDIHFPPLPRHTTQFFISHFHFHQLTLGLQSISHFFVVAVLLSPFTCRVSLRLVP